MLGCCYRFIIFSLVVLLTACVMPADSSLSYQQMPDFQSDQKIITAVQALSLAETINPLIISSEMTQYLDRYVSLSMPEQQRARVLHNILLSSAFLGIEYQRGETLTALQVFDKRAANCISFANLYIALARYYDLDANYQLIEKYPQWDRSGNVVSMDVHVNTVVKLNDGGELTVDISRGGVQQAGRSFVISDKTALALFYNNLSIDVFSQGEYFEAFQVATKAIASAPQLALLWSNLGAIYRSNNQWRAAEKSYQLALSLSQQSYTAMNNLAVLYQKQERFAESDYYLQQTRNQHKKNPYYHFYLAQQAEDREDYLQAQQHLLQAIKLKSDEPVFYQLLDVMNNQLDRLAINDVSSSHTWSGLNAAIHADISSSFPSNVQRRP